MTSVMKYSGGIMAILYIGIGVAILFRSNALFDVPSNIAYPLGSMMIVYGLFRGYRIYRKRRS